MATTAQDLHAIAAYINHHGLHTGDQLAVTEHGISRFDICAIAYLVTEQCWSPPPAVFFTDEVAGMDLIATSERAMTAIRAMSQAIDDYQVPDSDGRPDPVEHVATWVMTPPIGRKTMPSISEVIGCILRAAAQTADRRLGCTDAYGICITCGGHGVLTVDGDEIPYEELSPRRQQGHALGHRFHCNTSKPCPDCDGKDVVTDAAVSAHEASL